jgi:peptide/nickel transport system substrate-binding protein
MTLGHVLRKAILIAALAAGLALSAAPAEAADKTLKAVSADLKIIDPTWSTAYITIRHGYLVYDTLFALNSKFEPKPQMVDTYTVSADGKACT